jgi:polyphosphate kinase
VQYGFISTGNLNEKTANVYGDDCLVTANRNVMADINKIFKFLENPKMGTNILKECKTLLVCPTNMRRELMQMIDREIKLKKLGKPAKIILKLNSLSDSALIHKLYEAALEGVEIQMVVRGIFCAKVQNKKFKKAITAISIVDEYLEHSRVLIFNNGGKERVYISSADWMVRNLDHRLEAAIPILDKDIREELKDIIQIQLRDNVKARWLDNHLSNEYVPSEGKKVRSQIEIYQYLHRKTIKHEKISLKEPEKVEEFEEEKVIA